MAKYDETKQLRCSFCGKPQDQVRRLVAGPNVYICDECIELCQEIISEEFAQTLHEEATLTSSALPKPREIVEALSDYVIDQDEAKKILAVAVYNHYKRIQALDKKNKEKKRKFLNLYYDFRWWDVMLHFVGGGACVFFGYEIVCALLKRDKKSASR